MADTEKLTMEHVRMDRMALASNILIRDLGELFAVTFGELSLYCSIFLMV